MANTPTDKDCPVKFEEWLDYYSPEWRERFTEGEITPMRHCWQAAQEAARSAIEAVDVLRELVALKTMKDGFGVEPFGKHNNEAARTDYARRKPLAWDRAREVLGVPTSTREEK